LEVTVADFEFQVEWMQRNGSIVSLEEAIARRNERDSHRLFVLTFDDGYRDVFYSAYPLLSRSRIPFVIYVTTGPVESGVAPSGGGRAEPLTWAQLDIMAQNGATIGSHTHSHPDLRGSSPPSIEQEIETSDRLIHERLGVESQHFCYPYGFWSATADSVVRRRYSSATLGAGPPFSTSTDLFRIHRVPVQLSDSTFFFVRKMKSGLVNEERARRLINGYRGVSADE
jgi:peptidoglycan/xylan/chitin deacetylase (PgdA/CDA1 family)